MASKRTRSGTAYGGAALHPTPAPTPTTTADLSSTVPADKVQEVGPIYFSIKLNGLINICING